MEKVVSADKFSGVAIAGTAGPAMEMIKLFQLQLEHYEKVEGQLLSLEGKANQLSMMVRGNLPAAMQGLVVVPIFAGYDLQKGYGRLWDYDPTGGRYEVSRCSSSSCIEIFMGGRRFRLSYRWPRHLARYLPNSCVNYGERMGTY